MVNSRLDQLTDGASLLASSILIIAVFERTLTCLELLVYGSQPKPKLLMLAHGAIMVAVGIAAATVSLSPEWVRNIVSSLGVGVGFALRDLLYNALVGVQMPYEAKSELRVAAEVNDLQDANLCVQFTITKTYALGFEATLKGDVSKTPFRLAWSYLDKKVVQQVSM